MALWRLYYHIVWATKDRQPWIVPTAEPGLYGHIRSKTDELGGIPHAVGGIEDHVHLIASIPPKLAVADFVGQVKGSSSHWLNHQGRLEAKFAWQRGYGLFSISEKNVPEAIKYVLNQKDHHRTGKLIPALERVSMDEDGPTLQSV
jgi:REP element-mobilizing transposase RayT